MIQRIQSLYLALVALLSLITYFFVPVWQLNGEGLLATKVDNLHYEFALILGFAIFSLLQYKNRKRQFVLNRLNLLFNVILLVMILLPAYGEYNTAGLAEIPVQIANGGILPLINIVLLFFANKGIKRDEDLIKSIDRIR